MSVAKSLLNLKPEFFLMIITETREEIEEYLELNKQNFSFKSEKLHGIVDLIDDKPRPGAHGSMVAFIHPKAAHGVLIELVESAGPADGHVEGASREAADKL